ncbi:phosphate signaling complex protein PhoU [Thalassotalea sp. HSM 43]|uniref:phosphate signaling complex protein PhoU n=1 Tax=Thalassotalea sp. HSM 43 TaxID=2552945 RepID=UPI0010822CAE|nr:phosphate signaling complex protein PhoU [Thalassotalea sp. HSM 43]QBY03465.1 phosphate signaling complex protein PhoU [Thalassotalea sp. HSM 43]
MENIDTGRHISGQFNQELDAVRNHVMTMGGLVEQQLKDALRSVHQSDVELAQKVLSSDYKINKLEVDIDEECTRIIAKRQPAASDLRLVMVIIKTIADLERIADEAEKIAKVALEQFSAKQQDLLLSLENLGQLTLSTLHETLDAFTRMDFDAAVKVHQSDNRIDRAYEALMRQLMTYMMEDPRSIPSIMSVIWSARALERIGDRCQNVCEYVIYFVKGKVIRHISDEDVAKDLLEQ